METVRSCLGWQDFNRQTKAGMDIDNIRKSVRKKIANDYLTVTPPKKKSDILYLVTDNPRTIVYNYFYTS